VSSLDLEAALQPEQRTTEKSELKAVTSLIEKLPVCKEPATRK